MDRTNVASSLNTGEGNNRFKFQSFSSRVDKLTINVVRRSRPTDSEFEDQESYFQEAFLKWQDLNCTTHFKDFSQEIKPFVGALPTILYHKESIVNILEKHFHVRQSMAYDALVDLSAKMAKDLGGEFYPYFTRIMSCILPLLYQRDIKILEDALNGICYLFKLLAKNICADICSNFSLIAKFLGEDGETKPYIRHFMAEAFAFLMRKIRGNDLSKLMEHILVSLRNNPTSAHLEGIAMLLFECIKQVDHAMHSKGESFYKELLHQAYTQIESIESLPEDPIQQLLEKTTLLVLHHTYRQYFRPIINLVLCELDDALKNTDTKQLAVLMPVVMMFVTVRKASRVEDMKPVVARLQDVSKTLFTSKNQAYPDCIYIMTLRAISGVLTFGNIDVTMTGGRLILDSVTVLERPDLVYGFFLALAKLECSNFIQIELPFIIRYAANHFEAHPKVSFMFLSELLTTDALSLTSGAMSSHLSSGRLIQFPKDSRLSVANGTFSILNENYDWGKERDLLNRINVEDYEQSTTLAIPLIATALNTLPHIQVAFDNAWRATEGILQSLVSFLAANAEDNVMISEPLVVGGKNFVLKSLLGLVIDCLARLTTTAGDTGLENLERLRNEFLNDIIVTYGDNEAVLRGVYSCLQRLRSRDATAFPLAQLPPIFLALKTNLSSYHRQCRLYTLRILSLFEQPMLTHVSGITEDEICDVVETALEMEELEENFHEVRNKTRFIQKLNLAASTGRIPDMYTEFIPRVCLGIYTINLLPLWEEARKCLVTSSQLNREVYWTLLMEELSKFEEDARLVRDGFSSQTTSVAYAVSEPEVGNATKVGNISFECPTLSKWLYNEDQAFAMMGTELPTSCVKHFVQLCAQKNPRMDFINYFTLILKTLKSTPNVVDQKARSLVSLFFNFLEQTAKFHSDDDDLDAERDEIERSQNTNVNYVTPHTRKTTQTKLHAWLEIFASLRSPRSLYRTDDLKALYLKYLTNNNIKLQAISLDCLLTYNDKGVKPYAEQLRFLADETNFRTGLTFFSPSNETSPLEPEHLDDVMPIVMRILFGRAAARQKITGTKSQKKNHRKPILNAIVSYRATDIEMFINFVLSPFTHLLDSKGQDGMNDRVASFAMTEEGKAVTRSIPWRQQLGVLNLLDELTKKLRSYITPSLPNIIKVLMYTLDNASFQPTETEMVTDQSEQSDWYKNNRMKEIRTLAFTTVADIFKVESQFDFTPYMPSFFACTISPRLSMLAADASNGIPTALSLFLTWARSAEYIMFLVNYDNQVLSHVFSILSTDTASESAQVTVLDIIEAVFNFCENEMDTESTSVKDKLIFPYVDDLITHMTHLLQQSKRNSKFGAANLSVRKIIIVSRIAAYAKSGQQGAAIVYLLLPSLMRTTRHITDDTREHILSIWEKFIPIIPGLTNGSPLYMEYHKAASVMLSTIVSRSTRLQLLKIFKRLADINPDMKEVTELLEGLNACRSKGRYRPDYDRMRDVLALLIEGKSQIFTPHQWLPLLYQLVFNMNDPDEMAIRDTSTYALTRFMDVVKRETDSEKSAAFEDQINNVIYVSIKRGLNVGNESIRLEFVSLLKACVKTFPTMAVFADLVPLLDDNSEVDDEEKAESSFFDTIYHIQAPLRVGALSRLATEADTGNLTPKSITSIFMPILSAFFAENQATGNRELIKQCVLTLTALAKLLPWTLYHRLLMQHMTMVSKNPNIDVIYIDVLGGIIDAFHFDLSNAYVSEAQLEKVKREQEAIVARAIDENSTSELVDETMDDPEKEGDDMEEGKDGDVEKQDVDEEDDEVREDQEMEEETDIAQRLTDQDQEENLAERIHDTLIAQVLPKLNRILNGSERSNSAVVPRIPLAVGIVHLILALPKTSAAANLPRLLLSLCNTIRNRTDVVREKARSALVKINACLDPSYFYFILNALRASLRSGYELHVLGYTMHALLAEMMPRISVGQLDDCLETLMSIMMNDMFGAMSQKKEDNMTEKMKEAKKSRSPTSFEMLSKVIELKNIGLMLVPLKDIMSKVSILRVLDKVDDILRRIANGLSENPGCDTLEMMDFAFNLISENLDTYKAKPTAPVNKTQKEKNFEVQMKRIPDAKTNHFEANAHRFVFFGLNLFSFVIRRKKYDLTVTKQAARMNSFVDVVGNVMYSTHVNNVTLGVRIMSQLCMLDLPSVPSSVPAATKRSFQLIEQSKDTSSQLVQACFKLLTVLIRDKSNSKLTEAQLVYLLTTLRPDMEEPHRQSTAYSLLRAILQRQFMASEMYDLMQVVQRIIITSHTTAIRSQARRAYFLFLMDYPQGRERLKTQMSFVIKNLEYKFETGRQSIMELLHEIISKFGDEILAEYSEHILLALIMRLVNDDSSKCREMAAELIKSLLLRMEDRMDVVYKLLDKWLDQTTKANLQRAACQVYGLIVDALGTDIKPYVPRLIQRLAALVEATGDSIVQSEEEEGMDVDAPWEVGYYSLNTFSKLAKTFPKTIYSADTLCLWEATEKVLIHPHAWVRVTSARLFGVYFAGVSPITRCLLENEKTADYLTRDRLVYLAEKFIHQLKSQHLTNELATQIVKNLFFIGKWFYYLSEEEDPVNKDRLAVDEDDKIEDQETNVHVPLDDEESDEELDASALEKLNMPTKHSLDWLFRKASFTARGATIKIQDNSVLVCSSMFKWVAAMCNAMEADALPPYLINMITPIVCTINSPHTKTHTYDELKHLGNEILSMVQKKAGPTVYFTAYRQVNKKINNNREHRKSRQASKKNVSGTTSGLKRRNVKDESFKKMKRSRV